MLKLSSPASGIDLPALMIDGEDRSWLVSDCYPALEPFELLFGPTRRESPVDHEAAIERPAEGFVSILYFAAAATDSPVGCS